MSIGAVAKQVVEIRVIELGSFELEVADSGPGLLRLGDRRHHHELPRHGHAHQRAGGLPGEKWIEESGAAHPLRVLAVDVVHDFAVVGGDRPAGQFFQLMASPITQGTRLVTRSGIRMTSD